MPQFLLFAALFWVTAAPSQTILRSVSNAHQLALSQNVGIQSSNLQDQMARFDRKSAVSSYLPNVQAQAQSDYNLELPVQLIPTEIFGGPAGRFQEVRFGRPWNSSASIDFSQPIFQADRLAQMAAPDIPKNKVSLSNNRIALACCNRLRGHTSACLFFAKACN